MFQSLVITLREGVEAALIVGITLAYLAKTGRNYLRKTVYAALIAAFVASVGAAVVIARLNLNQDIFEGVVMLVAAVFVVTMILFMAKASKTLKGNIEKRVGGFASAGSKAGLFFFVFLLVLREGVETVLILSAVELTSTELLSFLGTLIGVLLAIAFGVMFVKGSVRIDLRKFFTVTTVILVFVAIQLTITGFHELAENGVVPSNRTEMAVVGRIVRNDAFFFVTMMALAALMVLFEYRRRAGAPAATPQDSAAARRKALWTARRERLWASAVYVSSFVFIMLVTAEFIYAKSTTSLSAPTQVEFVNGAITIPAADLANGDLHRYVATVDGHAARFLLYRKPDGKIATVMDACEVCGNVGFYKGAQGLMCKNCNAPVNAQSVGEGGGCNPIPLKASVQGANVIVREADFAETASHMHQE
jgi:high-affinity iron transporter